MQNRVDKMPYLCDKMQRKCDKIASKHDKILIEYDEMQYKLYKMQKCEQRFKISVKQNEFDMMPRKYEYMWSK